jgi:ubiquinone biosynthesis protein
MKTAAEKDSFIGRRFGGPAGFKKKLERLGPIFIKLGQFLALRPDLVPQEYCDELMGLFDRVPPFPPQEAFAILKADLGRDPTDLFAHLNPRPIAAGSLAQTHVARTKDGIEVAIKIQRPNIKAMVLRDLGRARSIARALKLSGASLIVSPDEVVEELTAWMMQEIDFEHELNNLTRLYDLSRSSPFVKIPEPFPHLSGPRVVTCEYLTGIPISELLSEQRDTQTETPPEINLDRIAENLISASLNQIFRYQFFHADLHPGNLFALPGDLIGFVDFGLCSELDEAVRAGQMRYLSAVYSGDVNRMFKALSEVLIPGEETDMEAFRAEFTAETTAALSKIRLSERNTGRTDRNESTPADCAHGRSGAL